MPSDETIVAHYADGSGDYRVYRDADVLMLVIPDGYHLHYLLTRDESLDSQRSELGAEMTERLWWEQGGEERVWIDGAGYRAEWVDLHSPVEIVVEDQRRSYPDMSVADAIAHARNTISVSDLYDDSETALAYRVIVETTEPQIANTISTYLPLDPAAYRWQGRSSSPDDFDADGEAWQVEFDPRPGYAQDEALYRDEI